MDTTPNQTPAIRFFYNGLKVGNSKLYKAFYCPRGEAITIYAREYTRFPSEIREALGVTNGTDTMSDYFEEDRCELRPGHPFYAAALEALKKDEEHRRRARKY